MIFTETLTKAPMLVECQLAGVDVFALVFGFLDGEVELTRSVFVEVRNEKRVALLI